MGNTFVETPHLDRLAKDGVVFTQAYASAPNCAPTRACLMSGQSDAAARHLHRRRSAAAAGLALAQARRRPRASRNWRRRWSRSRRRCGRGGYATALLRHVESRPRPHAARARPADRASTRWCFPRTSGFAKDAYVDASGNYLSDRLTDEVLAFIEERRERAVLRLPRRPCGARALRPRSRSSLGDVRTEGRGHGRSPRRSRACGDGRGGRPERGTDRGRARPPHAHRRHHRDLHERQRRHARGTRRR